MLRFVLVLLLAMSVFIISIVLLMSHFVPVVDLFLFGQPKLDCKPCICHPECHCETQCIQQQIMNECNLGVDTHNTLLSHHTHENRTTRLILVLSLFVNFLQTILLLFRKTVRNLYRTCRQRKNHRTESRRQASDRRQAERYTAALRGMIDVNPRQHASHRDSPNRDLSPTQPIFSLLSNTPIGTSA